MRGAAFGDREQYTHLENRVQGRYGWSAWIQFVTVQPARAFATLALGLLAAVATVLVPGQFSVFTEALSGSGSLPVAGFTLLVLVVCAGGLTIWKETNELHLVQGVRFLAFRAYLEDGIRSSAVRDSTVGRFSTQPNQIGQTAYVVDLAVTLVQTAGLVTAAIVEFGVIGLIAAGGVFISAVLSVALVRKIGRVFNEFVNSESDRIEVVGAISSDAESLRAAHLTRSARTWLQQRRSRQEPIMRRRAFLQTLSGLLTNATVPFVVGTAVLVAIVVSGPASAAGLIPLLVAATLLFSSTSEVISNYRVVRLAVPMLQAWDARRKTYDEPRRARPEKHVWDQFTPASASSVVCATERDLDDFRTLAMEAARDGDIHFVASPSIFPGDLFDELIRQLPTEARAAWYEIIVALDLPRELEYAIGDRRADSLSLGERSRLWMAILLTLEPDRLCLLAPDAVSSIDMDTRTRVFQRLASRGYKVAQMGLTSIGDDRTRVFDYMNRELRDRSLIVVGSSVSHEQDQHASHEDLISPNLSDEHAETPQMVMPSPKPSVKLAGAVFASSFGYSGTILLAVVAALSAILLVAFPTVIDMISSLTIQQAVWLLSCILLLIIAVPIALMQLQFRVPVRRYTRLHDDIADALPSSATRPWRGEYMGRFGSDFADMQMEVPGALVGATAAGVQVLTLVTVIGVAYPLSMVMLVPIVALSAWLYHRGSARLVTASTDQANARARFLDRCTALLTVGLLPSSTLMTASVTSLYERERESYQDSTRAVIRAQIRRRTELILLSLVVLIIGVTFLITLPSRDALAGAVIAYLIYSLSLRAPDLVRAFQDYDLAMLTAGRVRELLRFSPPIPEATAFKPREDLQLSVRSHIEAIREQGGGLIEIRGRSGLGKSTTLAQLAAESPHDFVLLPDDLEVLKHLATDDVGFQGATADEELVRFGGAETRRERQAMLLNYAMGVNADVVILDETASAQSREEQRHLVNRLRVRADDRGSVYVMVLHGAREDEVFSEMFDRVVLLD